MKLIWLTISALFGRALATDHAGSYAQQLLATSGQYSHGSGSNLKFYSYGAPKARQLEEIAEAGSAYLRNLSRKHRNTSYYAGGKKQTYAPAPSYTSSKKGRSALRTYTTSKKSYSPAPVYSSKSYSPVYSGKNRHLGDEAEQTESARGEVEEIEADENGDTRTLRKHRRWGGYGKKQAYAPVYPYQSSKKGTQPLYQGKKGSQQRLHQPVYQGKKRILQDVEEDETPEAEEEIEAEAADESEEALEVEESEEDAGELRLLKRSKHHGYGEKKNYTPVRIYSAPKKNYYSAPTYNTKKTPSYTSKKAQPPIYRGKKRMLGEEGEAVEAVEEEAAEEEAADTEEPEEAEVAEEATPESRALRHRRRQHGGGNGKNQSYTAKKGYSGPVYTSNKKVYSAPVYTSHKRTSPPRHSNKKYSEPTHSGKKRALQDAVEEESETEAGEIEEVQESENRSLSHRKHTNYNYGTKGTYVPTSKKTTIFRDTSKKGSYAPLYQGKNRHLVEDTLEPLVEDAEDLEEEKENKARLLRKHRRGYGGKVSYNSGTKQARPTRIYTAGKQGVYNTYNNHGKKL
eukprot:GHVN01098678.1.p1 GENE.GHVN01098678.1~~GHVN01098678.1.p1  ORF type:complete len:570 (-),score=76.76 GHVN01098678.1:35-1744(-)